MQKYLKILCSMLLVMAMVMTMLPTVVLATDTEEMPSLTETAEGSADGGDTNPSVSAQAEEEELSGKYMGVAAIRVNTKELDREGNKSEKIFYQRPGSSKWYDRTHAYNYVVTR